MNKMEHYEDIRKRHYVAKESIRSIAKHHGVHRRMVRQALADARPVKRRVSRYPAKVITEAVKAVIRGWLKADKQAPKKQRHTAHRIFTRLVEEYNFCGSEPTVRKTVGALRRELALRGDVFVPQVKGAGKEGEVDWYEAYADFPEGRIKVYVFQMRACFSGKEFHIAFFHQTQQAFLEGHIAAFHYFGGIFKRIRYDNLASAVKKVLKGRKRIETDNFILFRSHYLFEALFCQPGIRGSHEKGGVESGCGRFRRNHLVPVPKVENLAALNAKLLEWCQADDKRTIQGHQQSLATDWQQEIPNLLSLPKHDFDCAVVTNPRVNGKSLISVDTNQYSIPTQCVGQQVEARLSANQLICFYQGKVVATHERLQGRYEVQACLDHYLDVLRYKPGAFANSLPLSQTKARGQWPEVYQSYWERLQDRHGRTEGTLMIIEILLLHRLYSDQEVTDAVTSALHIGLNSVESIKLLIREHRGEPCRHDPLADHEHLKCYDKPTSPITVYDGLLHLN